MLSEQAKCKYYMYKQYGQVSDKTEEIFTDLMIAVNLLSFFITM